MVPPYTDRFPARMPDGRALVLPLRDLGETAVAGLIANQASFAVVDALAGWMAGGGRRSSRRRSWWDCRRWAMCSVRRWRGCWVIANWAALGTTRKLWYDEALSVPLSSITAPGAGRRLWLDPRLLPRLRGRRVLLVDDVISTGTSARAGLAVLRAAGDRAGRGLRRDDPGRPVAGGLAGRAAGGGRVRHAAVRSHGGGMAAENTILRSGTSAAMSPPDWRKLAGSGMAGPERGRGRNPAVLWPSAIGLFRPDPVIDWQSSEP